MNKNRVRLTKRQWCICTVLYFSLSLLAAWLFYDLLYAALIALPFFALFIKAVKRVKMRKYADRLTEEFLGTLSSLSTSVSAGISPENAFVAAASDMEKLYGDSPMVKELSVVNLRVAAGGRLTDALSDMARRTGIQEIYDFTVVFTVAKEKGSNLQEVISSCVDIMETKQEAECEARIAVRAKQYEQRIMCLIVPGILLYLRLSSGSFISVLYRNPFGITVMTICLVVYVFAIYLSEKIGDIRV